MTTDTRPKTFARFDGMTWPLPPYGSNAGCGLGWRLRYAQEQLTQTELYRAAEIVAAYGELIWKPQRVRDRVIAELRKAMNNE